MNQLAKFGLSAAILALTLFLLPSNSHAAEWESKGSVYIPHNQIIDGSFYASGQNIAIDGVINGDLIVAAQNISVSGEVAGDIIAIGQTIDIQGKVGGNLRILANSLNVKGEIARNVSAMANSLILDRESQVAWDVFAAASQIEIRGDIKGRLHARGNSVILSGTVGKNANIRVDGEDGQGTINVASQAKIAGDLTYCCQQNINIADQADIDGEIREETLPIKEGTWLSALGAWLISFLGILAIGLVMIWIDRKKRLANERLSKEVLGKFLLKGAIAIIITPAVAILLLFTVIGLPLAATLACLWILLILAGQAAGAIILGRLIAPFINKHWSSRAILCLVLGLIILKLLSLIPYAGLPIAFLVIAIGAGSLIAIIKKYND